MKKCSNMTYLSKRAKPAKKQQMQQEQYEQPRTDLNVFVVTFDGIKNSENNLSGGDPYPCKKCKAILNKYSTILTYNQYKNKKYQINLEFQSNQFYWQCQFCSYPNILTIEKQQIPNKDDVFYMLQGPIQNQICKNDQTMIFCIDISGSMNTTSQINGKINMKYGLNKQEIDMLKQFMQPGDQAQFNFLPGQHNKNKTFISRKQCILSAIENHLIQLKKNHPFKIVGFVTFNNQVTIIGNQKINTINILGDKLNSKEDITQELNHFKFIQPISESFEGLIHSLNKTQAKGQTALGPALLSAIEVASKGNPGSVVTLCTDGLANIGIGTLQPLTEVQKKFYEDLSKLAKQRNIIVNIMTIKGQGCKLQVIGKLAEETNGNVKVVNPDKLSQDFANVLKDEVVGLNVSATILLHKSMIFRHEDEQNLTQNKTMFMKKYANATINTRLSFQYQIRDLEDLKFMQIQIDKLIKVPFQAQIVYTSPKGGKFLRVISSESKTTTEEQIMKKQANLAVVHQRVSTRTAVMHRRGDYQQSRAYNNKWNQYLEKDFEAPEQQKQQQVYNAKSKRFQQVMKNQQIKTTQKMFKPQMSDIKEQERQESILRSEMSEQIKGQEKKEKSQKKKKKYQKKKSMCSVDSDEDEMQVVNNLMGKQGYDLD